MPHTCDICRASRRPVGRPRELRDGWAVFRWNQDDPIISGLATKGEGFKVLFALKHHWTSTTVVFKNGRIMKVDLK